MTRIVRGKVRTGLREPRLVRSRIGRDHGRGHETPIARSDHEGRRDLRKPATEHRLLALQPGHLVVTHAEKSCSNLDVQRRSCCPTEDHVENLAGLGQRPQERLGDPWKVEVSKHAQGNLPVVVRDRALDLDAKT